MNTITSFEYQGLFPLVGIAVVYWWRDRYFFNRGYNISTTQWYVLVVLYPTWAFLEWVNSLQVSRGEWYFIGFGTIGRTLVGHYTTIAIFNDSFVQTRQQALSFFISLFITYMWTILQVFMFGTDDCDCRV